MIKVISLLQKLESQIKKLQINLR